MDPPPSGASDAPSGESKAQEQARLRRQKRQAKIAAGGSERLEKITSLAGRPAPVDGNNGKADVAPSQKTPFRTAASNSTASPMADDPAEVNIDSMFAPPSAAELGAADPQELFRQMLQASGPAPDSSGQGPQGPGADDPIMQMMQQMLGGGSGGSGGPGGPGGMPEGLAAMFGGGQQTATKSSIDYIWRLLHAFTSLSVALYAAIWFPFTGSEVARAQITGDGLTAPKLFWIFTTMELVLQSTRYFVDGGQLPPSGWLGSIARILPEPYGSYVRVFSRYSIIYTTIMSDAMVVVFVFGAMAWWSGLAAS